MPAMHDAGVRDSLKRRIESLRPDSHRKWGRMTVDQMLWHVNLPMAECLGEYSPKPMNVPVPRKLLRWLVINIPWPRGARTRPDMVAAHRYDFDKERARALELVDRICDCDLDGRWPNSASMGEMGGEHWSRLHAKHLDHHLRQFGA